MSLWSTSQIQISTLKFACIFSNFHQINCIDVICENLKIDLMFLPHDKLPCHNFNSTLYIIKHSMCWQQSSSSLWTTTHDCWHTDSSTHNTCWNDCEINHGFHWSSSTAEHDLCASFWAQICDDLGESCGRSEVWYLKNCTDLNTQSMIDMIREQTQLWSHYQAFWNEFITDVCSINLKCSSWLLHQLIYDANRKSLHQYQSSCSHEHNSFKHTNLSQQPSDSC